MYNDRQEKILSLLNENGEIQISDLKKVFPQVSTMTLRRDLSLLESNGLLIRTHGGAVSIKVNFNTVKKTLIHCAAENVESKMGLPKIA